MNRCLNCGTDVDPGFSTCSSECATNWRGGALSQKEIPIPPNSLSAKELAEKLDVSLGTIFNWRNSGKIPFVRLSPRRTMFNLQAVKDALGDRCEKQVTQESNTSLCDMPQVTLEPDLIHTVSKITEKPYPGKVFPHIGAVVRSVTRDLMLEEAERFESAQDFKQAFEIMRDLMRVDTKLAEIFGVKGETNGT